MPRMPSSKKVVGKDVSFVLKPGLPPCGKHDTVPDNASDSTDMAHVATVSRFAMAPGALVVKAMHLHDNLHVCGGAQTGGSQEFELGVVWAKGPLATYTQQLTTAERQQ